MSLAEIFAIPFGLFVGYWIVSKIIKSTSVSVPGNARGQSWRSESRHEPLAEEQIAGEVNIAADWYKILGVSEDASSELIAAAYREKIRQYHPDQVARMGIEIQELAESKSKTINAAYDFALRRRSRRA